MKFVIKLVDESVRSNRMNRVSLTAESTTKVDKKNGKYHRHQILISPCLIFQLWLVVLLLFIANKRVPNNELQ